MKPTARDRLIIFDTTLRDGEQSPGCSMNLAEKLRLAHALSELGVDVLEAGFPVASPGDFEAVTRIAREVRGVRVCGLARCSKGDIETAWRALQDAERPRLHTFIATSPIHREHKLEMSREQVLDRVGESVRIARALCDDVQFSAEDAARTEPEFLSQVAAVAIDAGATTINIPDTVGYTTPEEFHRLFTFLRQDVIGAGDAVFSVHCHDDLGLAVANSLAAAAAGARQIECTINGIGERAGNCSLEEVVMALRTRIDRFGLDTEIRTEKLCPTSRLVSAITGVHVQPNKAIVGANAFAHEAGIHQHGVLRRRDTYEIIRPEDVGYRSTRLVLGKHSGRHAFRQRVTELGLTVDDAALESAFAAFKRLADRKKQVDDADLEALVFEAARSDEGPWKLEHLHASAGTGTVPTASVRVRHADGRAAQEAAVGDGPIDATFKALTRATEIQAELGDYRVNSVGDGEDAQGLVTVDVVHEGRSLRGRGVSTDIIEASALAVLDVVNRISGVAGRTSFRAAE